MWVVDPFVWVVDPFVWFVILTKFIPLFPLSSIPPHARRVIYTALYPVNPHAHRVLSGACRTHATHDR